MAFRRRDDAAERLAAALDRGDTGDPETADLVRLSKLLAPSVPINETARAATRERMLRAARAAQRPVVAGAGSHDMDQAAPDVYSVEVEIASGVRVVLADIEPLNDVRVEGIVERALIEAQAPRER